MSLTGTENLLASFSMRVSGLGMYRNITCDSTAYLPTFLAFCLALCDEPLLYIRDESRRIIPAVTRFLFRFVHVTPINHGGPHPI